MLRGIASLPGGRFMTLKEQNPEHKTYTVADYEHIAMHMIPDVAARLVRVRG